MSDDGPIVESVCAVAFFPWAALSEPITLGSTLRLLPYAVGKLPGDLPHATQADLDGVLSAYANRPGIRVPRATILEVDSWKTGTPSDERIAQRLFRARTAIGFAALGNRWLFAHHMGYCCYDTYSLVVQRYRAGDTGKFMFNIRHRDGDSGHYWTSAEFAFQRPLHVDTHAKVEFERPLAERLMQLADNETTSDLFEAINEFNSENTDSQAAPAHVEVIMIKSAFEWLLDIDHDSDNFARALLSCLPEPDPVDAGPLTDRWAQRFCKRPRRPIEAWAREFCDLRGTSAHGRRRQLDRFVWPRHTHLAFASILFPLIVKARLAQTGQWILSDADGQTLRSIESYLVHDPFAHDRLSDEGSNPWTTLRSTAKAVAYAKRLWPPPPS